MRTGRAIAAVTVATVTIGAGLAGAATRFPTPGSPTQVAALVAKSSSIQKLPAKLLPSLAQVAKDNPGSYYGRTGNGCATAKSCVLADAPSKTTVVLFGDSHAWMWLPALVPVVQSAKERLVVLWRPGCPAATISVWSAPTHSASVGCNTFRAASIKAINKLAPKVVLLSDRTSDIPDGHNVLTTNAAWQAGLEQTIAALKTAKTKVVVIGDITAFTATLPECLAAFPTAVQTCSAPNPNTKTHQHFAAEEAAATAEAVSYVNPQPWLCTTTCSPIVGTMVAYFDKLHVSATYAEYLSKEFAAALKGVLTT